MPTIDKQNVNSLCLRPLFLNPLLLELHILKKEIMQKVVPRMDLANGAFWIKTKKLVNS